MTRRARKHPMTLEVHIMFEPNREEHQVLHHAYSFLLPLPRRRLLTPVDTTPISAQMQDPLGERKHS
ncbi:hypothetical protein [Dictyobacter formicarum]|uniref:Uncharacterized protein n=1 Tax=Dictyobacter formicarum TaxID=2778368 RepID=A0ABQ3VQR3_9CHLR|nr:hypothetical protein [Dictyobacter formicarum]GHO82402.1 hypothetical protein KSZ_04080 [Dictyobacter formicarum]GHO88607.1 hypothetical protein KSZ_66130 [Dictyobacter formicarum]